MGTRLKWRRNEYWQTGRLWFGHYSRESGICEVFYMVVLFTFCRNQDQNESSCGHFIKAYSQRAKAKVKTKNFFDVCCLFFFFACHLILLLLLSLFIGLNRFLIFTDNCSLVSCTETMGFWSFAGHKSQQPVLKRWYVGIRVASNVLFLDFKWQVP